MTRFRERCIYLASVVMALAVSCASCPSTAEEQGVSATGITIGGMGALTGPLAFIGTPGRDGMTLAFNEINAQGRGLRTKASRCSSSTLRARPRALRRSRSWSSRTRCFVLVLASGSTGAAAAADYVREIGVPTYNLYGSTPIIREPFSKNVFHGAIVPVEVAGRDLIEMFYDDGG